MARKRGRAVDPDATKLFPVPVVAGKSCTCGTGRYCHRHLRFATQSNAYEMETLRSGRARKYKTTGEDQN